MVKGKHIITIDEILSLYKEKNRYITLANSYVRDYQTAEEIVSQCIFKLIQTKDDKYVSDARHLFATAVKNRCLNFLKQKRKECGISQDDGSLERIDLEIERLSRHCSKEEFRSDMESILGRCRNQMSDLTYEVFMAKRLDRMTYQEIGRAFNISRSRINFEIGRALKVLRKEFRDFMPLILWAIMVNFQA